MKSLYIHIPFCDKKCFYCSFVVSIGQQKRVDEYLDALSVEAKRYEGQPLKTIYIGGGTPSFLNSAQIEMLFKMIRDNFDCSAVDEITFELNPENVYLEKVETLLAAGVTRVSCGIQTFNDKYLKFLGRNHSGESAKAALLKLKEAGFHNISADFMFSLPGQSEHDIAVDLRQFKQFGCQHVSLYALTIEPNARFYTRKIELPNLNRQADQYVFVRQEVEALGFKQYEVSNFAQAGFESKHNINYWDDGEYLGLGVGAHSYVANKRFWNVPNMFDYLKRMRSLKPVIDGESILTNEEQLKDAFLFGLRMNKGVDVNSLQDKYGCAMDEKVRNTVSELIAEGYMLHEPPLYKATDKGRLVLDEISVRLL